MIQLCMDFKRIAVYDVESLFAVDDFIKGNSIEAIGKALWWRSPNSEGIHFLMSVNVL